MVILKTKIHLLHKQLKCKNVKQLIKNMKCL